MYSYPLTSWMPSKEPSNVTQCTAHCTAYPQGIARPPQEISLDCPTLMGAWDELSIEASILLKGHQICVPPDLQLYSCWPPQNTPGNWENVCTSKRGSVLAWHQCWHCQLHQKVHHMHKIQGFPASSGHASPRHPNNPWQEITADYLHHKGKGYLLICYLFSKYPFLSKVTSNSAHSLSKKCQDIISRYGPPRHIYIHNSPPFDEFMQFLQWQHINHTTSSPHSSPDLRDSLRGRPNP